MTPSEELHLKAAKYANRRRRAYLDRVKKGLGEKLSKEMVGSLWIAHYEGYYEGYRDAIQTRRQA